MSLNDLTEIFKPDAKRVKDNIDFTVELLSQYAQVYFGVSVSNLNKLLFDASVKKLLQIQKDLTVYEVVQAYTTQDVQKRQFVSLSVDEVCEPIVRYKRIRDKAYMAIQNQNKEIEDFEKEKIKAISFLDKSFDNYKSALELDFWAGTHQQASTLLGSKIVLPTFLTDELKIQWHSEEKKYYDIDKITTSKDPYAVVLPIKYRLANRIIENCIYRKIEPNEENYKKRKTRIESKSFFDGEQL